MDENMNVTDSEQDVELADEEQDDVYSAEVEDSEGEQPYELSDEEIAELADEEDDDPSDDEQDAEFSADEGESEDDDEGTDGEDEPSDDGAEQQPPDGGEDAEGEAGGEQPATENAQSKGGGNANATPTPDYAKMAADDLAAIQRAFPGLGVTDLRSIDNAGRFGVLREKGMSAEEAFRATNYERINAHVAAVARSKADGKAHIRGDMPAKGTSAQGFSLTAEELRDARELFPDKSDKEITELYRSVSKQK